MNITRYCQRGEVRHSYTLNRNIWTLMTSHIDSQPGSSENSKMMAQYRKVNVIKVTSWLRTLIMDLSTSIKTCTLPKTTQIIQPCRNSSINVISPNQTKTKQLNWRSQESKKSIHLKSIKLQALMAFQVSCRKHWTKLSVHTCMRCSPRPTLMELFLPP